MAKVAHCITSPSPSLFLTTFACATRSHHHNSVKVSTQTTLQARHSTLVTILTNNLSITYIRCLNVEHRAYAAIHECRRLPCVIIYISANKPTYEVSSLEVTYTCAFQHAFNKCVHSKN